MRPRRVAGPRFPRRHVSENPSLSGDPRGFANRYVAANSRLARQNATVTYARRAGDADLRHDEAEATDFHVVPDLNEIVDLRSIANDRIVYAPSIHCSVGTNLDVVPDNAPSDVRNLGVLSSTENVPESIRAEHAAGMRSDSLSDFRS